MRAELSRFRLERPKSLDEALDRLAGSEERLTPLAGGTDLLVYLNAGTAQPGCWIDIWGLQELMGIREDENYLVAGALTTFWELRHDARVRSLLPLLAEAAATVGAVAIQNRATLGGNIANGSPAGDSLPPLLAYDAEIGLRSRRGHRWVPFDRFYTGYRASVLAPDELIEQVRFHKATANAAGRSRFVKVGTRSAQAISKVVAAFTLGHDHQRLITRCRVAMGSVAPTPIRVRAVEDHLRGLRLDAATLDASVKLLKASIAPIDDVRSTASYRRWVAARIWERFLTEQRQALG